MDRWIGKTAVVTGASAGIGATIALDLANAGVHVVALARRRERLEELKAKVSPSSRGAIHPYQCDITSEQNIKDTFAWIDEKFGGVDILVNNAGILKSTLLLARDNSAIIQDTVNTNILGVVYCTREAFHSMKSRGVDGHIVNINSTSGHYLPYMPGTLDMNIYAPTKFAVTALTETLRQELIQLGTNIKITSVSPGNVRTEIYAPEEREVMESYPYLNPEDISNAVLYALGTKPHVQIHEIIIRPVGETC